MHAPAASPHSAAAVRAAAAGPSSASTRSLSQSSSPKMQLASASHFTAAMMADDGADRADSAGAAHIGHAARSKWSALPSDLVRLVLSFTTNARSVWSASHVCTNWRSSVDHHTVWAALCSSAGWIVPAGLPRPFVRAFFVDRYRTVRHYSRAYWSRQCSWVAHAAGILHLAVPPLKEHYSWSSGRTERIDEGLIISAASAPTYGLKVWRTSGPGLSLPGSSSGSSSSSSKSAASSFQPECLNEQHVYGNPLLLHAANGSGGSDGSGAGGNGNTGSSAQRAHPLDPVSSNLKTHWSCVDIYTTGSISEGATSSSSNAAAMTGAMQAGSWEAQQMYAAHAAASSSSAGSADFSSAGGHNSIAAPPARSSNFLLFAGMHRPLLYLYDLHAKRMRAFKPGHTSAICCVKMGRDLPADAAPVGAAQPFGSSYAASAPRRRLAVSGGYNDEVCVWDVDLGTLVARLRGGGETAEHPQPSTAWCVDIHARGRLVAAGSNSGVIRIYKLDLAPGEVDEDEAAREAALTKEEKARRDREKKMEAMRALLSANTEDDQREEDEDPASPATAALPKRNPWESLPPFVVPVAPPVAAAPAAEDGAEAAAAAPAHAVPPPVAAPLAAASASSSSSSSSSGPSPGGPAPAAAVAAAPLPPAAAAPVDPLQNLTAGAVLLLTLEGHTKSPMTVQFDPYAPSTILWSAGYDKTIRQWDIDPRNVVESVHPPPVRNLRSGSRDEQAESKDAAAAAGPSEDEEALVASSGRPLLRRGQCLRVFTGHTAVIFSLVITPHVVFSSSRDGCVRIWDRDSGCSLRELECNRTSSDLVSEIQGANVSSEQGASLSSSRSQSRDIKCLALTAEGAIVTASSDGRIQMFEFETRASRELKVTQKQKQTAGKHDPKGNNSNRAGVQSSLTRSLSGGGSHGGAGGGDRDANSPDEPSCVVM